MERVLMKEVLTDRSGRFHLQPVSGRQGVHTHHLYDLFQLCFFLEKAHHLLPVCHPVRSNVLIKPLLHIVQIQRVAGQPVNGRKMSLVGQRRIQPPEHFYNTKGSLGYRLGNISSRRRHGADNRQSPFSVLLAQRDHMARSLVKLCQTGTQICRIPFLARHLFQTAGHLTKSFCPAGCGVSHKCHRITHVPEIFRNGDTRVNRSLTGSHRHIGSIGDKHCPLHQRLSGLRILQFRELVKNVGHLIATFPAADIDYNICLRPFCQLVLDNGLAASEGSRNGGNSSLCNREEGIDNPLSCDQRLFRRQLFQIRAALAHRPFLH